MEKQQEQIRQKIAEISDAVHELPCIVVVHNIQQDFSIEFMSKRGADLLGTTQEELAAMGNEYFDKYFNHEESKNYVGKITDLLQRADGEQILSFFQQVKILSSQSWTWFMTTLKIFMFDEDEKPLLTVTTSFPIDPEHQITTKVARLLEENNFLRKNNHNFSKLSKREKEVLKFMAYGCGSQEIADKLFISLNTVKTHRKKVIHKLEIKNAYDINEYARAFDLI